MKLLQKRKLRHCDRHYQATERPSQIVGPGGLYRNPHFAQDAALERGRQTTYRIPRNQIAIPTAKVLQVPTSGLGTGAQGSGRNLPK